MDEPIEIDDAPDAIDLKHIKGAIEQRCYILDI